MLANIQEKEYVVYTICEPKGTHPIYVGLTQCFVKRIGQHKLPSTWKRNPQNKLYQQMSLENRHDFVFSIHNQADTLEEAQKFEEEAIRLFNPVANTSKGTRRTIKALNFHTNEKKSFFGVKECSLYTEQSSGNINKILSGYVHSVNGWIFSDALQPKWDKLIEKAKSNHSSKPRRVLGIELSSGIKREFDSLSEAARFLGKPFGSSDIGKVCSNKKKTAYGHSWSFI